MWATSASSWTVKNKTRVGTRLANSIKFLCRDNRLRVRLAPELVVTSIVYSNHIRYRNTNWSFINDFWGAFKNKHSIVSIKNCNAALSDVIITEIDCFSVDSGRRRGSRYRRTCFELLGSNRFPLLRGNVNLSKTWRLDACSCHVVDNPRRWTQQKNNQFFFHINQSRRQQVGEGGLSRCSSFDWCTVSPGIIENI